MSMAIRYGSKQYDIINRGNKIFIKVGKKEVFAGYGVGNMNSGFKIEEKVVTKN